MFEALKTFFKPIFYYPVLNLLLIFYGIFNNLGVAVILFAAFIRILLIPLSKKQQEMQDKMQKLQPEIKKLQKKYKHNQQKLAQEQMKLYREVGYNPFGCLGTFLPQVILLFVIFAVIRAITADNFGGAYDFVKDWFFNGQTPKDLNTHFIGLDLSEGYRDTIKEHGASSAQALIFITMAIVVGLTQYLSSKFIQKFNYERIPEDVKKEALKLKEKQKKKEKNEPMSQQEMQEQMGKSLMYTLPIIAGLSTFTLPAVFGVYWITQSFMLVVQYIIIDRQVSKRAFANFFKSK